MPAPTQADLRRSIRVALITRMVDAHGNLHAPAGAKVGGVSIGGRFVAKALADLIGTRRFLPASTITRLRLRSRVQSGGGTYADTRGGNVAVTKAVTFPGGTRAIHKRYPTATRKAAVEYAVSLVGEAVRAPVPAVVLGDSPGTLFMDFVEGSEPAYKRYRHSPPDDIRLSDDGLLLGLLDALVGNGDRHGYNWRVDDDGKLLAGIDHGEAFKPGNLTEMPALDWITFVSTYVIRDPFGNPAWRSSNPMHPADLALVRVRLERLEPVFDSLGLAAEYSVMLRRLDALAARATGTVRRIT